MEFQRAEILVEFHSFTFIALMFTTHKIFLRLFKSGSLWFKQRVDDFLDHLYGTTVFSIINLKSGYNLPTVIKECSIKKKGFRLRLDHCEYIVLSFGLTFVVMTIHMVNCKSPCPHSLPCCDYIGDTSSWVRI
jgi:hypothetical protein